MCPSDRSNLTVLTSWVNHSTHRSPSDLAHPHRELNTSRGVGMVFDFLAEGQTSA